MWFPKNKITKAKYTYGDRFKSPNGKPYTGPYFETSDGRYIAGETPTPASYELSILKENKVKDTIPTYFPTPTEKQYSRGVFTRYFLKDSSSGKVVEVNEKVYSNRLQDRHISGITVEWYLKGPIEDRIINGVKTVGTETKNKSNVILANTKLIGVLNYVRNFKEFVRM